MGTLQTFLAAATQQSCDGLIAAVLRLPDDKRNWQPEPSSRSALDQVAECAVLTGYVADILQNKPLEFESFEQYGRFKAEAVESGWEALHALLSTKAQRMCEAISEVPDEALDEQVLTLIGSQSKTQLITYPYWNMTYHQGQINYIASLLDCLK